MQIAYKNNKLLLSFPYNRGTIDMVKAVEGRSWDPKHKAWLMPALLENLTYIRNNYRGEIFLTAQAQEWEIKAIETKQVIKHAQKFKENTASPVKHNFKTTPFVHQIRCINFFKNLNVGALFLEMGLGKTKIIIDLLSYHYTNNNIKKILYVCPNSVMENVKYEFELHSNIKFDICILSGNKDKRLSGLKSGHDVYIINYEALQSLEKELMESKFDCIICDESTRIKNPQAQCSKVLHRLGHNASYRYILTGTPITQSAIDIYSQYKFLEPSIFGSSYYVFRNKYTIMGGYMDKQIIGYKNLNDLEEKIFLTAMRFKKSECLDLPDKIYEVKQFDLNNIEQKLYDDIKKQIFIELEGSKISTPLIITKLMKLTQVCSGFARDDAGMTHYFKSSKMELLMEILDSIVFNNKIIIWCNFLADIERIDKELSSLNIDHVCFCGETERKERQDCVDKFQNDPKCKVFVGQIRTGGMGINLTAASYVIYYSNTYSLTDRLQSEDRAHRIGQINKVTYIDLVARKTIEKSILKILKKKLDLATLVIDNNKLKEITNGEY